MSRGVVHIVGAGLAGLSAAVALAGKGARVALIEAAPAAGGRCRSYFEPALGLTIDNGNHLILSGNHAVYAYLKSIGAEEKLSGPPRAEYAFVDRISGERWTIRPNESAAPWWIFCRSRRVPGTRTTEYLALRDLMKPGADERVSVPKGPLWDRLLRPLLLAALNTEPERASARLVAAVLAETIARGGKAYRPRIASPTLAAALVDPALRFLEERGAGCRFGERVKKIHYDGHTVRALETAGGRTEIAPDDCVILAVPPWIATALVPGIATPDEFRAIVSGHFAVRPPPGMPSLTGLLGATAEWVFAFTDRISVTISNADRLIDTGRKALAELCWRDVASVFELPSALPQWQIVKEKRATVAATPQQERMRPGSETPWNNLFLAGDWTDTGLPSTIEGAVRSGQRAAELALCRAPVL